MGYNKDSCQKAFMWIVMRNKAVGENTNISGIFTLNNKKSIRFICDIVPKDNIAQIFLRSFLSDETKIKDYMKQARSVTITIPMSDINTTFPLDGFSEAIERAQSMCMSAQRR
jgi:hypothetical protein